MFWDRSMRYQVHNQKLILQNSSPTTQNNHKDWEGNQIEGKRR